MIHEVKCPDPLDALRGGAWKSVFIAGGIGGATVADWQHAFIKGLADLGLLALNPRRESFPDTDESALIEQIAWEYEGLRLSQAISFWFPANYSCPITVFELGVWSTSAKPIFVGIDPDYPLKVSLTAQLQLNRPNVVIVDSLDALAIQVRKWAASKGEFSLPEHAVTVQPNRLYLAGGISGCPDWQNEIRNQLQVGSLDVHDPRIPGIDATKLSAEALRELSLKNHRTLISSGAFCVWYPKEAKSPTSLFELGALASYHSRPLFVGAEDDYFRKAEVVLQLCNFRPDIRVANTLDELAGQVNSYFAQAR